MANSNQTPPKDQDLEEVKKTSEPEKPEESKTPEGGEPNDTQKPPANPEGAELEPFVCTMKRLSGELGGGGMIRITCQDVTVEAPNVQEAQEALINALAEKGVTSELTWKWD